MHAAIHAMKEPLVEIIPSAIPFSPPPADLPPDTGSGSSTPSNDSQSLDTGLRGARLYRVTQAGRGGVYWEAAVILNEVLVHRRFAGELHARAWLSLATELSPSAIPFDLEEIHGRFRAACVAASRAAPP